MPCGYRDACIPFGFCWILFFILKISIHAIYVDVNYCLSSGCAVLLVFYLSTESKQRVQKQSALKLSIQPQLRVGA